MSYEAPVQGTFGNEDVTITVIEDSDTQGTEEYDRFVEVAKKLVQPTDS